MPAITGLAGTASPGTIALNRAVGLSGWFGTSATRALTGVWATSAIGNISAFLATYWVSPTGAASWANAKSSSPLSGSACCSLAAANANASAGDAVYLRGGAYAKTIQPTHSGTLSNRVTWRAYADEVPVLTIASDFRWGFLLSGVSYNKFIGIQTLNSWAFFYVGYGSCYNEWEDCIFDTTVPWTDPPGYIIYDTGLVTGYDTGGTHILPSIGNYFHECRFSKYGGITPGGDDQGTIATNGGETDDSASNTTFYNCTFNNGGHDAVCLDGRYNVLLNCNIRNDMSVFDDNGNCVNSVAMTGPYFGNRAVILQCSNSDAGGSTKNSIVTARDTLIEGCRIHHSGLSPDDEGSSCIENAGIHTMIRFNDVYASDGAGIYVCKTQPYPGYDSPQPWSTLLKSGSYSRTCHNTIYHTGIGLYTPNANIKDGIFCAAMDTYWYPLWNPWPVDAQIKNNINYDWHQYETYFMTGADVTYTNNFNTNPLFVNTDTSDPTSTSLPDLQLQDGSGCIGAGESLTLAKGSGSGSVTLIVDDANWFQDGTTGSSLAHGVTHFPDEVSVGSVSNHAYISSINSATKKITLVTPLSWDDNAPVWIYRKADGVRVLYGTAPDIGAHPKVR